MKISAVNALNTVSGSKSNNKNAKTSLENKTLNSNANYASLPSTQAYLQSFGAGKNKLNAREKAILLSLLGALAIGIPVSSSKNKINNFPNVQEISAFDNYKYSSLPVVIETSVFDKNDLWKNFSTQSEMKSAQYAEALLYHDMYITMLSLDEETVLNNIANKYSECYKEKIDAKSVKKYFETVEYMQKKIIPDHKTQTIHKGVGVNSIIAISSPEKQEQIEKISKWADNFYNETGAFPIVTDSSLNTIIKETKISSKMPYLKEFTGIYLIAKLSDDIVKYEEKYNKEAKMVDISYRDVIKKQKEAEAKRQRELEIKKQEEAKRQAELQRQREIEAENQRRRMEEETRRTQDFYQSLLDELQSQVNAANAMFSSWY